jgi:hypothetical protein
MEGRELRRGGSYASYRSYARVGSYGSKSWEHALEILVEFVVVVLGQLFWLRAPHTPRVLRLLILRASSMLRSLVHSRPNPALKISHILSKRLLTGTKQTEQRLHPLAVERQREREGERGRERARREGGRDHLLFALGMKRVTVEVFSLSPSIPIAVCRPPSLSRHTLIPLSLHLLRVLCTGQQHANERKRKQFFAHAEAHGEGHAAPASSERVETQDSNATLFSLKSV